MAAGGCALVVPREMRISALICHLATLGDVRTIAYTSHAPLPLGAGKALLAVDATIAKLQK